MPSKFLARLLLTRGKPKTNASTTTTTRRSTSGDDTAGCSSDFLQQTENTVLEQQDPELLRLLTLNPWEETDRQKYDDAAVLASVKRNPNVARVKYEFDRAGRGSTLRYPLFKAVALGASLEVVQLMGTACPASISEKGVFGNTALHSGCAYQASLDVILYLLGHHPEIAGQKNKHGYTPLQNVCEYGTASPVSLDVIPRLIEACPEALGWKNKLGNTPYKTAAKKGADDAVLSLLESRTVKEQGH